MNDNIYDFDSSTYPDYAETSSALDTSALQKLQLEINSNKGVGVEIQKHIGSIVCDSTLRGFAANVLNKLKPTLKLSEQVGLIFILKGFYTEQITYKKDNKIGEFTFLFGLTDNEQTSIALNSSSRKIAEAVQRIRLVYGEIKDWDLDGILVKVCANMNDGIQSYTLEVVE
jgi:succinate dehydrogenase flavin-adding protein (antitoxin of CptAB toxin-antitoxin module)